MSYLKRRAPRLQMSFKRRKLTYVKRRKVTPRTRRARSQSRGMKRSTKQRRLMIAGQKPDKSIPLKTRLILDDNNGISASTRTQYPFALVNVPLQTSADEIDRREGLRITTRGFAVDMHIRQVAQSFASYLNIAIVIPRKPDVTIPTAGFFRNWDTTRELDFDIINSWWLFNRPINKDKYEVITHRRYLLASQSEDTIATQHLPQTSSFRHVKFYQKMVRQFVFNSAGTIESPSPFLIYWMDGVGQASLSGAISSVYTLQRTVRLYYQDD